MILIANRKPVFTQVNVNFVVPGNVAVSAIAEHVEDAITEQGGTVATLAIYPPSPING